MTVFSGLREMVESAWERGVDVDALPSWEEAGEWVLHRTVDGRLGVWAVDPVSGAVVTYVDKPVWRRKVGGSEPAP